MNYEQEPANTLQSTLHTDTLQAIDARIGLLGYRKQLETQAALDSPDYDNTVSDVAFEVSKLVHKSIKFKYDPSSPPQITVDHIENEQTTSCYGLTTLASEALEVVGVEHYVAFANNHAFVLVPLRSMGVTLFINPSNPRLDGEISRHQQHFNPETLDQSVQKGRRSAAWFSSELYANFSKGMPLIELLGRAVPDSGKLENDWLTTESNRELTIAKNYSDRGTTAGSRKSIASKRQLVTSVYNPSDGRKVLYHYGQLQHFAVNQQPDEALEHLDALGELYPEIDVRSDQYFFMVLLQQLVHEGREDDAYNAVHQLHQNLVQTGNPKADIMRADYTRHIGQIFGNEDALREAIKIYESAENERNKNIIANKTKRVKNIINGLGLMRHADVQLES